MKTLTQNKNHLMYKHMNQSLASAAGKYGEGQLASKPISALSGSVAPMEVGNLQGRINAIQENLADINHLLNDLEVKIEPISASWPSDVGEGKISGVESSGVPMLDKLDFINEWLKGISTRIIIMRDKISI